MPPSRKILKHYISSLNDIVNIYDTDNILVDNPNRIEQFYIRLHSYIMDTLMDDIQIHVCFAGSHHREKLLRDYETLAKNGAEICLWTDDETILSEQINIVLIPTHNEITKSPFLIVTNPSYMRAFITWASGSPANDQNHILNGVLLTNPMQVEELLNHLYTALQEGKEEIL